jgi:hypothetical protein
MASKRRNPKKNRATRRRRSDMPGLRRARLQIDDIHRLMSGAPPAALPLVGLASVWLWNVAQDRHTAAHCVDGCLTLHYALAEYGIRSHIEAVAVELDGIGGRTVYGEHPRYNSDGTFNGHTVLAVTGAGRFIDPTIQQFAEVPGTRRAALPLQGPLPASDGMGELPVHVNRGDHTVIYQPVPQPLRQAWRGAVCEARDGEFREAGANLAANVLAMLQVEDMRPKALQAPYPRLRQLLIALEGADPVADSRGFRFTHPATGKEISLADVP